ncbi:MAP3K12-binding inhibitory protein 1 [Protopterus annectens]|uniref:MAP3K12-binding inhibitory protein 1 n=1 Tax=Protopterus annectens TaxID=7888 RepID=UPI001CFA716A|nr:MAP3K12-binding inhibitory protein 1 [Protopterus annectens]
MASQPTSTTIWKLGKMNSLETNDTEMEHQSKGTEEGKYLVDPEIVQIMAGKAEVERRISAFIERKRIEINENNIRDFCNVIDCDQENSCARTDAIFTPYPGHKSHVKVSRVVNSYGPQTRTLGTGHPRQKTRNIVPECGNQAVEERLQNMEAHLKLFSGSNTFQIHMSQPPVLMKPDRLYRAPQAQSSVSNLKADPVVIYLFKAASVKQFIAAKPVPFDKDGAALDKLKKMYSSSTSKIRDLNCDVQLLNFSLLSFVNMPVLVVNLPSFEVKHF